MSQCGGATDSLSPVESGSDAEDDDCLTEDSPTMHRSSSGGLDAIIENPAAVAAIRRSSSTPILPPSTAFIAALHASPSSDAPQPPSSGSAQWEPDDNAALPLALSVPSTQQSARMSLRLVVCLFLCHQPTSMSAYTRHDGRSTGSFPPSINVAKRAACAWINVARQSEKQ